MKKLKINLTKLKKKIYIIYKYKQVKYTCNFQNFWTVNTFGRDNYNGTVTTNYYNWL